MKIENDFEVAAPIDEVWAAMLDADKVAACVPGAQVLAQLGPDLYQFGMKIKIGPVSMQYKGEIEFVEKDESAHRAVLRGKGKETRGHGNAEATSTLSLTSVGEATRCQVEADLKLSGRVAAMGQGIIKDVSDRIAAQFAGNLQRMLSGADEMDDARSTAGTGGGDSGGDGDGGAGAQPERSGATVEESIETASAGSKHRGVESEPEAAKSKEAPVEQARGDARMTGGSGESSYSRPRIADFDADADDSLDGLGLAKAVVAGRLKDPRAAAGVIGFAVLIVFWLGRRSAR